MNKNFYKSLLNKKKPRNELTKLFEIPKPDSYFNSTTFEYIGVNEYHQADLLETPNDKGFLYALVVVDQGSRICDAVALKSKSSLSVSNAFKKIYEENKILPYPKFLVVDNGTEFKGEVIKLMNDKDVTIKRNNFICKLRKKYSILANKDYK